MTGDDWHHAECPRISITPKPVPAWVRTLGDWLRWRESEDARMVDAAVAWLVEQHGDAQPPIDVAALRAMLAEHLRSAVWGGPQ